MKITQIINQLKIIILAVFVFCSCSHPNKEAPGSAAIDIKSLKPNSPEDERQIQKSKDLMMDLWKQLNFIPESDYFLNVVKHCKDNHLFVNAHKQSYIIVAVSNKGINQIPESDQIRLKDTSDDNNGYKLKFLTHHIIICPKIVNPGIVYRTLAGDDVFIADNRSDLHLKQARYLIQSSIKISDELEIIAVDSVLYR